MLLRGAGNGHEDDQQQDVQDEGEHLRHPDAGRGVGRGDARLAQEPDVQRGAADRDRRDQGHERARHLDQERPDQAEPLQHEAGQRQGGADVGRRGQRQPDQRPAPVQVGQQRGQLFLAELEQYEKLNE